MSNKPTCLHCGSTDVKPHYDEDKYGDNGTYDCNACKMCFWYPTASTECEGASTSTADLDEDQLEERFRQVAKGHQIDGEIEFDQGCKVSLSEDTDAPSGYGGAYVQAWYYIPYSEIES